jgi:hypothetical protein
LGRKIWQQRRHLKKLGNQGALVAEEGVTEKMAEFITPIAILGDQDDQVHYRNWASRLSKKPG